ncbi:MAG: TatD family hydrolase [Chloroflexi bacterium OHK40]
MLLDAHTHLDHYQPDELDAALSEIAALQMLTVAVAMDPASYTRTRAIATRSPLIVPCFGIHPWEAHRYAHDLTALRPLVAASPMLGEVGLDYVWDEHPAHYPAQRAVLAALLEQAAAEDKVVNLHTKGAEHDVLAMLQRFGVRRAIVHWYSGPRDAFEALVAHGCFFTFGVETPASPAIQELARDVPLDRLLSETDGPGGLRWLTGEVGMPRHVLDVLRTLADLRGLSVAAITAAIAANWRRLCAGDARLAPWVG